MIPRTFFFLARVELAARAAVRVVERGADRRDFRRVRGWTWWRTRSVFARLFISASGAWLFAVGEGVGAAWGGEVVEVDPGTCGGWCSID